MSLTHSDTKMGVFKVCLRCALDTLTHSHTNMGVSKVCLRCALDTLAHSDTHMQHSNAVHAVNSALLTKLNTTLNSKLNSMVQVRRGGQWNSALQNSLLGDKINTRS